MRVRGSGWQVAHERKLAGALPVVFGPSAWERLLAQLNLPEQQAALAASERTAQGERLRYFIEREFARRYVPEDVLAAVGLLERAQKVAENDCHGGNYRARLSQYSPAEAMEGGAA
jgi:hypothetical protein